MSPVTLYDLPSKGRNACWSLNPWKTRLALNYKGIDYKTDWLEYPDVAPTLKAAGFEPNDSEQSFPFTIPAIRFPDGAHAMESAKIVQELEKRYPEPSLHLDSKYFPLIRSLISETSSAFTPVILAPIPRLILSEKGAEYFNNTRSKMFGMTLDQLEAERGGEQAWTDGLENLAKVAALLKEEEGPYFMGHTVSYADLIVVAFLQFAKRLEGGIFDRIVQFDSVFSVLYNACEKWLERDNY